TLFILTIILVVFSMTIIVIVRLAKKAAESDELRKAKDIADHSNAAKSDFLANMSHEIRTPINAVLGMNEMILRESLSSRDYLPSDRELIRKSFAEICNFAGNIESAGTNLLSIINDILDFSKIEAGKLEIVEGRYKLSSVLNDLCNMISFKAKEKGLKFKVDVDPAIPDDLYGDEVRFRQVITNILNNAVKYTHEGSVHMSVEKKDAEQMKDGRAVYLVIKIKDTGIGIKEEDIDRLFSKFERMDLGKNSTVEGTGLGLAITKSLLTMMGGSIEVDSEYGRGSQFTVILPQAVMSDEPVGDFKTKYEKSMLERKAYTESFRAPDAYILVVDDTSMNLTVVKGLLKNTDINIETAGGGIEAVNMATKLKYDLILMDQRMPGMDGTQAMHRILEFQNGPNIDTPFICLTADAVSGAKERYMQEGFTDYLTKPIDYEALERMLVKYLPKEKILPGKINAEQQAFADSPDMSGILEAAGVDTKAGLLYSRNSEEFYRSVLEEYLNNSREKEKGLEKYLEQKNWKDYSILVHALKSTSKMIGAVELSSMAADLEKASDAADEETVVKGHPAMMKEFIKLTDAIKEATGYEPPEADEDTAKEEDDEILEFLPQ
ncbi:MAG: response regulator, partial [Lachnospiraceae bacterium]|nr:response regulator [Lachnospiraceae bacterium]